MKVSLSGALGNAARCIDRLMKELESRYDPTTLEKLEEECQPRYIAGSLREIAAHAADTRKGVHSLDEFAEFYCLKEVQK